MPKSHPQKSVDQAEAILDFFLGILQRPPETQTFSEPEFTQPSCREMIDFECAATPTKIRGKTYIH